MEKTTKRYIVASFTDAWIETFIASITSRSRLSHLLQMRGLKRLCRLSRERGKKSHLLQMRGLKPILTIVWHYRQKVASFTDAWIETAYFSAANFEAASHLLQMRGLKQ